MKDRTTRKKRSNQQDDAALASLIHAFLVDSTLHGKVRTLADMTPREIDYMVKLYGPLSPNANVKHH